MTLTKLADLKPGDIVRGNSGPGRHHYLVISTYSDLDGKQSVSLHTFRVVMLTQSAYTVIGNLSKANDVLTSITT
jgi:hypothetical protein